MPVAEDLDVCDEPDVGEIEPPEEGCDDGDDDGDSSRWITVATFWQATEAHIARLKLESEEIDCVLIDENLVATDWLYANAVGGIKLRVPEADANRARELLGERPPAVQTFEQSGLCPECGSSDLDRPVLIRRNAWSVIAIILLSTTVLWFAMPLLLVVYFVWLRPFHCRACDHVFSVAAQPRGFEVKPPPRG